MYKGAIHKGLKKGPRGTWPLIIVQARKGLPAELNLRIIQCEQIRCKTSA